jgi:hypothetical protein
VNTDLGSPLAEPIRHFVAHKRALNRRFDTEERALACSTAILSGTASPILPA